MHALQGLKLQLPLLHVCGSSSRADLKFVHHSISRCQTVLNEASKPGQNKDETDVSKKPSKLALVKIHLQPLLQRQVAQCTDKPHLTIHFTPVQITLLSGEFNSVDSVNNEGSQQSAR